MTNRESEFRITHDGTQFVLTDPAGAIVRVGENPKRLANWAFGQGAESVRWSGEATMLGDGF